MTAPPRPRARPRSRLRLTDALALGALGMRGRPVRAALSALGIALGIAAVVGVLGLSASSAAGLLREIDALGTDMLQVQAGQGFDGKPAALPEHAAGSVARLDGVRQVAWTATLEAGVYRNPLVDRGNTAGLALTVTSENLPAVTATATGAGHWLTGANTRFPVAVLGANAATRLGITAPGQLIDVDGVPTRVVGILRHSTLAPELDTAVLVGADAARRFYGWKGRPGTLYVRATDDAAVGRIRELLPSAANPLQPNEVAVSRPSDALVAKARTRNAFTGLFLGLGAVALLVGGVGVANVMVISVLERRGEIGLRRALGARRPHVAAQFALEALYLSTLGGLAGAALGAAVTTVYARVQGWEVVVPATALVASAAASVAVGAVAGLYPAVRAARVSPTQALTAL